MSGTFDAGCPLSEVHFFHAGERMARQKDLYFQFNAQAALRIKFLSKVCADAIFLLAAKKSSVPTNAGLHGFHEAGGYAVQDCVECNASALLSFIFLW